jgi:hypothetical protein
MPPKISLKSILGGAAFLLLLVLLGQTLLHRQSEWQDVYVRAARQWWGGTDIYAAGSNFLYPPFQVVLAFPFIWLPDWLSRLGWFAMSTVGLIVMTTASWRISGGAPFGDTKLMGRQEWFAFALGTACSLPYILNAFAHQQTDVMIGGVVLAGLYLLSRKEDALGGTLIGVAAAFKATPMLFAPYLAWRGRWAAALLVGFVALILSLLPDVVPAPGGGIRLAEWTTRYVIPTQHPDIAPGTWGSGLEYNQSIWGTAERLANTTPAWSGIKSERRAPPSVEVRTLKLAIFAVLALVIGISVVVAARSKPNEGVGASLPRSPAYEFSMVLILMLLMSPMSGRAHFGILILPAFCLSRSYFITRNRALGLILAVVGVISIAANKDLVGSRIYDTFLWLGATTFCTGLLWIGCVCSLHALRRNCKQPARSHG